MKKTLAIRISQEENRELKIELAKMEKTLQQYIYELLLKDGKIKKGKSQ